MPKNVDYTERREAVATAVLAIAARAGLESATVREVAREAGCTTGTLSHYFRDKREMLEFAFRLSAQRTLARWAQVDPTAPALDRLRAYMAEFLPLDDERRGCCAVWLDSAARALGSPELARRYRESHRNGREQVTELLIEAAGAGELVALLNPALEAEVLVAFVTGLARQALVDPDEFTPERQLVMLDAQLAHLNRGSAREPTWCGPG